MLLNSGALNTAPLNAASGPSGVTGSSSAALPGFSGSASGVHGVVATSLAALLAIGGSMSGVHGVKGTSSAALPTIGGSATGSFNINPVVGTSTGALPGISGTATGSHAIGGTSTAALPTISGTATGTFTTPPVTGTSSAPLPAISGSASGVHGVSGSSTGALPGFGGSATGAFTQYIFGTSSAALPGFSGSASGTFTAPPPAWRNLNIDTAIVGATFRAKFQAVYTTKLALQSAIDTQSKTLADSALTKLTQIASDNLLTADEKTTVFMDWKALYDEEAGIYAQATAFGLATARDTYKAKWDALRAYLNAAPIYMEAPPTTGASWNPTWPVSIDGPTFRTYFADVYTTRQDLLNAIAAKAKASGDDALAQLVKVASDGWLSAGEKPGVALDWNDINDSKAGLLLSAASFSPVIDSSAFSSAWRVLADYLNEGSTYSSGVPSALQTPYIDTAIASPSTWISNWKAAYGTRADLMATISAHTKSLADSAVLDLAKIASDGWLSKGEIPGVLTDWNDINDSKAGLVARAASFSPVVDSSAFTTAWQTLGDYLNNTTSGTYVSGVPACLQTPYTDQAIASPSTWLANWKAAYSTRSALQDAITAATKRIGDQINSPDYLTPSAKQATLAQWNAEVLTQTSLHSDAASSGTPTAAYDAAVLAVDYYLYTTLAAYTWKTTWATDTTTLGPVSGVVNTLGALWGTVAQKRSDLVGAIASGKNSTLLSSAATDAQNRANIAQLAAQPHRVAWAYSALPALNSGNLTTYPDGYYAITTDMRTVQRSGNSWIDVTVSATGLFGRLFAKNLTIANFDNLFPNPNGVPQTNYSSTQTFDFDRWSIPDGGSPTGYCHRMVGLGGTGGGANQVGVGFEGLVGWNPAQNLLPVNQYEEYYMEGMFYVESQSSTGTDGGIYFTTDKGGTSYVYIGAGHPARSGWSKISIIATAPAGATQARVLAWAQSDAVVRCTALTLRRRNDSNLLVDGAVKANKLESDLAMVNVIRSFSYVAGSYGNAPSGFKLSGYTFSSTLKDGTVITANMEIGGDINMNGYKVATVTGRVMTAFNRVANGTFFGTLSGWVPDTPGYLAWSYDSTTSVGWGGSAALVSTRSDSYYEYGRLVQSFTCPPSSGTVLLDFYSRLQAGVYDADGFVEAWVYDPNTGASGNYRWTYAAADNAWTQRTWNISSIVASGGDFIIEIYARIRTNTAGSKMLVDNVKIVI